MTPIRQQGFTLIELAVVLVILGLLVGGVVTGQHIIRRSEINSIWSDFREFETSMRMFKDRYEYWPGDLPNTTDFWPSAYTGNGDGIIGVNPEPNLVWWHLERAELIKSIPGGYPNHVTVANTKCGANEVPGCSIPGSKVKQAGYFVRNVSKVPEIDFGRNTGGPSGMTRGAISVRETYALDTKYDDGIGRTGHLRADFSHYSYGDLLCVDHPITREWQFGNSGDICRVLYSFSAYTCAVNSGIMTCTNTP